MYNERSLWWTRLLGPAALFIAVIGAGYVLFDDFAEMEQAFDELQKSVLRIQVSRFTGDDGDKIRDSIIDLERRVLRIEVSRFTGDDGDKIREDMIGLERRILLLEVQK